MASYGTVTLILLIVPIEGLGNFLVNFPYTLFQFCHTSLPQPAIKAGNPRNILRNHLGYGYSYFELMRNTYFSAVHTGENNLDLLVSLNLSHSHKPRTFHLEHANWLLTLYKPSDEDELFATLEGISQEFSCNKSCHMKIYSFEFSRELLWFYRR